MVVFADGFDFAEMTEVFGTDFPVLSVAEEKFKSFFAVALINISHYTAEIQTVVINFIEFDIDNFFLRNDFITIWIQKAATEFILQKMINRIQCAVAGGAVKIKIAVAGDGGTFFAFQVIFFRRKNLS